MLAPAWPAVGAISWWILAAIVFIAGGVGSAIVWAKAEIHPAITAAIAAQWLVVVVLLVLGAARWPALAYRHTRYIVSPQGIEIRRGVIWRSVTNVPRSRVQHTDVTQGPIMRRHNLATLVMHTAGTQYAIVSLPGLSYDAAIRLRDFLIRGSDADAV
jgi:membrane protein YdbS with pleckstrin-like domain